MLVCCSPGYKTISVTRATLIMCFNQPIYQTFCQFHHCATKRQFAKVFESEVRSKRQKFGLVTLMFHSLWSII